MNRAAISVLAVVIAAAAAGGGYWFGQSNAPSGVVAKGAPAGGPGTGGGAGGGGGGPGGGAGGGKGGGAPPGGPLVEASQVTAVPLPETITAVGSLRSDESVIVRPEVAGRIATIHFREGQRVAKGMPLVTLDAAVNHAELRQAQANLDLARAKHARSLELQQRGFISAQARDEAENSLKVAEAALALMQARLAKTEIRAPFSGIIGLRSVSVGDYVKEGQDLVNLESIDPLKVDFRIPEIFMKEIKVGQPMQVALDALPGSTFQGQVYAVNPLVDTAGRSFVIRAVVRNPDTALRPGMFARVRLITKDVKDALVVPEQALVPQGSDQFVFRIIDGKAVQTRVDIGQRSDGRAEIVGGLTAGDVIVTAGQVKVRDGMQVRVAGAGGPRSGPNAAAGTAAAGGPAAGGAKGAGAPAEARLSGAAKSAAAPAGSEPAGASKAAAALEQATPAGTAGKSSAGPRSGPRS